MSKANTGLAGAMVLLVVMAPSWAAADTAYCGTMRTKLECSGGRTERSEQQACASFDDDGNFKFGPSEGLSGYIDIVKAKGDRLTFYASAFNGDPGEEAVLRGTYTLVKMRAKLLYHGWGIAGRCGARGTFKGTRIE